MPPKVKNPVRRMIQCCNCHAFFTPVKKEKLCPSCKQAELEEAELNAQLDDDETEDTFNFDGMDG